MHLLRSLGSLFNVQHSAHGRTHSHRQDRSAASQQSSNQPTRQDALNYLEQLAKDYHLPANKKTIFTESDWAFSLKLAGEDTNGDGVPDVVLEAYSGGAHCCWTYYIISLGSKPGMISKFENQRDAAFIPDNKSRRIMIVTTDGAFDYFDGLCHACSPFPAVYLRLDGTRLIDMGPQYERDYDKTIAETQRALSTAERQRLRHLTHVGEPETSSKALTIVLAYLYSGREAQARDALRSLWPVFDQERIWTLILQTRRGGILRYVGQP